MRFADLEPEFIVITNTNGLLTVGSVAEANGVIFKCPACSDKDAGGAHSVIVPFADRGVPPNALGGLARWKLVSGTGFDDLTIAPSILLGGSCTWHGFITNGDVLTC